MIGFLVGCLVGAGVLFLAGVGYGLYDALGRR
jgi:hypothetical protein